MISDLDKNKSGSIDFEEFLDMMTARMSDKDTREDIAKVFRLFDDDTSGSITLRNLRRVAKELGETMTDEDFSEGQFFLVRIKIWSGGQKTLFGEVNKIWWGVKKIWCETFEFILGGGIEKKLWTQDYSDRKFVRHILFPF